MRIEENIEFSLIHHIFYHIYLFTVLEEVYIQ